MPRHTSFVWSLFFKSGYYLLTHGDYFLWNINFFHLRKICSNGKKKSPVNFSHPSFWSFPLNFQLVLKPATGYIILYFFFNYVDSIMSKAQAFRHNWGQIESSPETPLHYSALRYVGFQGWLHQASLCCSRLPNVKMLISLFDFFSTFRYCDRTGQKFLIAISRFTRKLKILSFRMFILRVHQKYCTQ